MELTIYELDALIEALAEQMYKEQGCLRLFEQGKRHYNDVSYLKESCQLTEDLLKKLENWLDELVDFVKKPGSQG